VERRAEAKGNTDKTCTRRTPSRESVISGLERVRERARQVKKEHSTYRPVRNSGATSYCATSMTIKKGHILSKIGRVTGFHSTRLH
jgi:hypothetical protein